MSYRYYPILRPMPDLGSDPSSGLSDERQQVNSPETPGFVAWNDRTDRIFRFRFQTFTAQEWATLRQFFDRAGGRAKPFYLPSWQADFELATSAAAGDFTMTVTGNWHTNNLSSYRPDSIGRRLLVVNQLGQVSDHWVVAVENSGGNDTLTLEDPLPFDLTAGKCIICICYLSRLANDNIESVSLTPEHVSCTLSFREITNRRRFDEDQPVEGFTVGNLLRCAEVLARDVDPAKLKLREYATLGPAAYATPQTSNFISTWIGALDYATNLVTLDGPGPPFVSTLYNGTAPADQLAFTFGNDGKEVLAWVKDGAARIRWFASGVPQTRNFEAFSVVAYNTLALATTTDAADSTVVVFYLKPNDASIYCRILADNFSVERRYCKSPLAPISLHTVNQSSGRLQIVAQDASHRQISFRSASWYALGNILISYIWEDQPDLDTGTTFAEGTVGFALSSSTAYMAWTGDDTSDGGVETVDVNLPMAYADGFVGKTAKIKCAADWYPNAGPPPGSGPATLQVEYNGVTRTKKIFPGDVTPSTTNVATVIVFPDGTFEIN